METYPLKDSKTDKDVINAFSYTAFQSITKMTSTFVGELNAEKMQPEQFVVQMLYALNSYTVLLTEMVKEKKVTMNDLNKTINFKDVMDLLNISDEEFRFMVDPNYEGNVNAN